MNKIIKSKKIILSLLLLITAQTQINTFCCKPRPKISYKKEFIASSIITITAITLIMAILYYKLNNANDNKPFNDNNGNNSPIVFPKNISPKEFDFSKYNRKEIEQKLNKYCITKENRETILKKHDRILNLNSHSEEINPDKTTLDPFEEPIYPSVDDLKFEI